MPRLDPSSGSDISTKLSIKAAAGGDSCSDDVCWAQRDASRLASPRHGKCRRGQGRPRFALALFMLLLRDGFPSAALPLSVCPWSFQKRVAKSRSPQQT